MRFDGLSGFLIVGVVFCRQGGLKDAVEGVGCGGVVVA